jgi:hypothetical protein
VTFLFKGLLFRLIRVRIFSLEPDFSERYNEGVVPPPELSVEPGRLQRPAWQPTPAQVEAARKQLNLNLAILALLVCACIVVLALLLGWRP